MIVIYLVQLFLSLKGYYPAQFVYCLCVLVIRCVWRNNLSVVLFHTWWGAEGWFPLVFFFFLLSVALLRLISNEVKPYLLWSWSKIRMNWTKLNTYILVLLHVIWFIYTLNCLSTWTCIAITVTGIRHYCRKCSFLELSGWSPAGPLGGPDDSNIDSNSTLTTLFWCYVYLGSTVNGLLIVLNGQQPISQPALHQMKWRDAWQAIGMESLLMSGILWE